MTTDRPPDTDINTDIDLAKKDGRPPEQSAEAGIAAAPEPLPPPVGFGDWALFPVFITVFLGSLILFDLVQRIALLFGERAHERSVLWLNRSLLFALRAIGTTIRKEGICPIKDDTPCIIISNHQSLFDIPLLATSFPAGRPRYVAKQELGNWLPSVSLNLRRGGSALIDRSDPRQAIPEIKRLGARMLEKRFSAVIFPEGTRARRGTLRPFHHAGLSALLHAAPEAPIVPVVIDGTWQLSAYRYGPIPIGREVRLRYLPPITRDGKHPKQLIAEAREVILAALEELRSEHPAAS